MASDERILNVLETGNEPGEPARSSVTLHIVSPGIREHRHTLANTSVATTIAQLKLRIQDEVSSSPAPGQQRLIYQGRPLLESDATLETVFGAEALKTTDTFTIHMALRPLVSFASALPASNTPSSIIGASNSSSSALSDTPQRGDVANPIPSQRSGTNFRRTSGRDGTDSQTMSRDDESVSSTRAQAGESHSQRSGESSQSLQDLFNNTNARRAVPHPVPGVSPAGQPELQHLMVQQMQLEHQIQNLMAAQQRLSSQQQQLLAADRSTNQDGPQQQSLPLGNTTSPRSNGEQATQRAHPQAGLMQQGFAPNGSWRVSVQQTTVHRPNSVPMTGHSPFVPPQPGPQPAPPATNLPNTTPGAQPGPRNPFQPLQQPTFTPFPSFPAPPMMNLPQGMFPPLRPAFPPMPQRARQSAHQTGVPRSTHFPHQLFLVSSPAGYQALLVPPQGQISLSANFQMPLPSISRRTMRAYQGGGRNPIAGYATGLGGGVRPAGHPRRRGQRQVADLLRILLPLGGHLWLLIRLLGFVYLFAGGATWSRTLLMSSIALVVFLAQAGWLNPIYQYIGDPVRRHVEGLVRIDPPAQPQPAAPQQNQASDSNSGAASNTRNEIQDSREGPARGPSTSTGSAPSTGTGAGSSADSRPISDSTADPTLANAEASGSSTALPPSSSTLNHRTPPSTTSGPSSRIGTASRNPPNPANETPAQLADRLLRETNDQNTSLVRDSIRRVERGIALFVTSLVPGWGEQHVRAAERAEREMQRFTNEAAARQRERELAVEAAVEAAAEAAEHQKERESESQSSADVQAPGAKAEDATAEDEGKGKQKQEPEMKSPETASAGGVGS